MSLPAPAQMLEAIDRSHAAVAIVYGATHCVGFVSAAFSAVAGSALPLHAPLPFGPLAPLDPSLQQALDRAYATGREAKRTDVLFGPAGKLQLRCQVTLVPWRDAAGLVAGVWLSVADSAEVLAARQRAQASEARLQALIDAMPQAVFVTSQVGQVLYANTPWRNYTGLNPRTMTRADWRQSIVHPQDAETLAAYWRDAAKKGRFEAVARLRDQASGSYRWQQMVGVPTYDFAHDEVTWVGSWTDIDDRVCAERASQEARDHFVAAFSHDLRSPLTALRIGAESLLRREREEGSRRRLQRMVDTIDRTNGMLETLLDLNLVRSGGQVPVHLAPMDLALALQASCSHWVAQHGARLVVDMAQNVRGVWHAASMTRAVDNLLGNAFKYGDPKRPVTLRVVQDQQTCRISVHNEGTPIACADQDRIFRPYERLMHGAEAPPGWGIGLSLVRGVALAHGGDVALESSAANGTCFTLQVPNAPAGLPRAGSAAAAAQCT